MPKVMNWNTLALLAAAIFLLSVSGMVPEPASTAFVWLSIFVSGMALGFSLEDVSNALGKILRGR